MKDFKIPKYGEPSNRTEYLLYLDIIRICGIVAVVVLHVSGGVRELLSNNIGSYSWWAGNIGESISRWAVPSCYARWCPAS